MDVLVLNLNKARKKTQKQQIKTAKWAALMTYSPYYSHMRQCKTHKTEQPSMTINTNEKKAQTTGNWTECDQNSGLHSLWMARCFPCIVPMDAQIIYILNCSCSCLLGTYLLFSVFSFILSLAKVRRVSGNNQHLVALYAPRIFCWANELRFCPNWHMFIFSRFKAITL